MPPPGPMVHDEHHAGPDHPWIARGTRGWDALGPDSGSAVPVLEATRRAHHRIRTARLARSFVETPENERAAPRLIRDRQGQRNAGSLQILVHLGPAIRVPGLFQDSHLRGCLSEHD